MEPEQIIPKNPPKPEQTITKTPPPYIKNPKRVAQGKRLAAISRAAKQKKKDQMKMVQEDEEKRSTTSLITSTGTILGTCCTILLTYIAYSQWSTDQKENPPEISKATLKKSPVVYKDLSQYDL